MEDYDKLTLLQSMVFSGKGKRTAAILFVRIWARTHDYNFSAPPQLVKQAEILYGRL